MYKYALLVDGDWNKIWCVDSQEPIYIGEFMGIEGKSFIVKNRIVNANPDLPSVTFVLDLYPIEKHLTDLKNKELEIEKNGRGQ